MFGFQTFTKGAIRIASTRCAFSTVRPVTNISWQYKYELMYLGKLLLYFPEASRFQPQAYAS